MKIQRLFGAGALLLICSLPLVAQSSGGSLVDGPGTGNANPQFYIKLPFAGPVQTSGNQFEMIVHKDLLPSVTSNWNACTFVGTTCFDILQLTGGGVVQGTGATVADAVDVDSMGQPKTFPADEDVLSAAIIEGAQTDRFQGSVRSIGGKGFGWFLNWGPSSATYIVGAGPTAGPSASGFFEFVNTSFNPASPQPFVASSYYDIVSASTDASDASVLKVAIELVSDPGSAPESSSSPNYTPVYSFVVDTDGDPGTGNPGGFDTWYSVFFANGQLRTSREIWNGSHQQIAGAQQFQVSRTGSTLLAEVPAPGRSDTFRWTVASGLLVNPSLVSQQWYAQIDPTSVVQATAFASPSGSGTQINTTGQLPQNAVVANSPFGSTSAAAWEEAVGGQSTVFGSFFDVSGNALAGSPFTLQEPSSGAQTLPAIGWIDPTKAIFVWSHQGPFPKPFGGAAATAAAGSAVVGRFFNPQGQPQTQALLLNEGNPGESQNPQVSADAGGNTVITWEDSGQIRGQRRDSQGAPVTPVFDLSAQAAGAEKTVTASSSGGSFATAWVSGGALSVRFFEDDGVPRGPVSEVVASGAANPDIAVAANGNTLLVWDAPGASGRDVFGQRFSASGVAQGPPVVLPADASGDQRNPSVGGNDRGESIVVWQADDGGIGGRFFDLLGSAVSNDVVVANGSGGSAEDPDASLGNDDAATVVYTLLPGDGTSQLFTSRIDAVIAAGSCTRSETVFCALANRFNVTVNWRDQFGNSGSGQAVRLTSDTGYFWFFAQANVELVVKVLDGCGVNDSYWVFAGGLTDVEATIVVDDSVTGNSRTYFNPLKTPFAPIQDTGAFPGCTANRHLTDLPAMHSMGEAWADVMTSVGATGEALLDARVSSRAASTSRACNDAGVLCLDNGRFEVEVDWRTATSSGAGEPVAITLDTGYFWFFDAANIELVVKVLDACAINNSYWVFAGGLTDQGATVRVTDTVSGQVKTYTNSIGTKFAPIQDTGAFATCP